MNVRLAGGIVPPTGSGLWLVAPVGGRPLPGEDSAAAASSNEVGPATEVGSASEIGSASSEIGSAPPGTPVAVGPADSPAAHIRAATSALALLVAAGGQLAAGGDVDLGHGFRSARIDGGRGDRRDCLLAALTTDPSKLGPPSALLTGLFGVRATRRVGAAARAAMTDGRWPALRFAAAASDVLGPEQVEHLLTLETPDGIDPFGEGLASDVAAHLDRLFKDVAAPRRAKLLTDLWEQAGAAEAAKARTDRLRRSQDNGGYKDLTARYRGLDEAEVLISAYRSLGEDARPGQLARWTPPVHTWETRLTRMLEDALAVTILARVAEDAAEIGVRAAIERHWEAFVFAGGLPGNKAAKLAGRHVEGLIAQPARPAVWLRNMVREIRLASTMTPRLLTQLAKRVARARDWGEVLLWEIESALYEISDDAARRAVQAWGDATLADWRRVAGHFAPERLATWYHRRPGDHGHKPADRPPLSERPAADERVDDLFWLGELADQVARLHGLPAAEIIFDGMIPDIIADRGLDEADPFVPRAGPITAAVTAAAQLAELGGTVPEKPRTWAELAAGLFGTASVAEALTGVFTVPPELAAAHGTILPGTELRIEVARTGRQLAEWGAYMGNCIGGGYYAEEAGTGRSKLLALRDSEGRIVLNVELVQRPEGWWINQVRARFNGPPEDEQWLRIKEWARRLRPPRESGEDETLHRTSGTRRGYRTTPAARTLREAGPELRARLAGIKTDSWVRVAALLPGRSSGMTGTEAVIALRRVGVATLTDVCRRALAGPDGPDLRELWETSGQRPLREALTGLPERLAPLAGEAPLAGQLRPLSRVPEVTAARAADLVALRTRLALGRLIAADDPDLARHLAGRPPQPMLCAMALAATGLTPSGVVIVNPGATEVPGFPATALTEDPWLAARPAATELGAAEPDATAAAGLRVPASWIPRGWPPLWSRATRR